MLCTRYAVPPASRGLPRRQTKPPELSNRGIAAVNLVILKAVELELAAEKKPGEA